MPAWTKDLTTSSWSIMFDSAFPYHATKIFFPNSKYCLPWFFLIGLSYLVNFLSGDFPVGDPSLDFSLFLDYILPVDLSIELSLKLSKIIQIRRI
jgi:hypothetical protein